VSQIPDTGLYQAGLTMRFKTKQLKKVFIQRIIVYWTKMIDLFVFLLA